MLPSLAQEDQHVASDPFGHTARRSSGARLSQLFFQSGPQVFVPLVEKDARLVARIRHSLPTGLIPEAADVWDPSCQCKSRLDRRSESKEMKV